MNTTKKILLTGILFLSMLCEAQITSSKDGDIEVNKKTIAEIEKYEGNAQSRPKFRVINEAKDTLILISFRKDFSYDWMQFFFPGQKKTIEINTDEIIKGLNYRKNIGSFLVKNQLISETGTLNETGFASLAEKYKENLTEKYFKLNEMNRVIATTKFEFNATDNKFYINGKHVGYATIPDGQQADIRGIVLYDVNNKQIGKGDVGMFSDFFQMNDGKELKLGVRGKTTTSSDKIVFAASLLRELFRNGYYKI